MKKFLLMIICMSCLFFKSNINISAEENMDFGYGIFDGEVTIYEYYGTNTNLVIPEEIEGYPVTKISDMFTAYEVDDFNSITISKNVKQINGIYVNDHDDLIQMPFSAVTVNEYIVGDENDTFASYDGSIYSKDMKVLYRCPDNRENIQLYPEVERIEAAAFLETEYTSIELPKTVMELGYDNYCDVFSELKNLKEITVEEGNPKFKALNGALFEIKGQELVLVKYPYTRVCDNYQIPEGTTIIAKKAFQGENIREVSFPKSLKKIEEYGFYNCDNLVEINLPDNIISVGAYAFYGCDSLKTVMFSANVDGLDKYVFAHSTKLQNVFFPEGIINIDMSSFSGCTKLISITLPKSVSSIKEILYDSPSCILNVHEGSYAYTYAQANNLKYKIINDCENEHKYNEANWKEIKAPTCTEVGIESNNCVVCNAIITRELPALGHNHDEANWKETKAATCTEAGKESNQCTRCDEIIERELPALGHNHDEANWKETKAATCTEAGKESNQCTRCDEIIERELPALGHNHDEANWKETKAATCTEAGKESNQCTRCDEIIERELPALGHNHDEVNWKEIKEPTCTKAGKESNQCTRCDKIIERELPALGHTWGDWIIIQEATIQNTGLKERNCKVCGEKEVKQIPKTTNNILEQTNNINSNSVIKTNDEKNLEVLLELFAISGLVLFMYIMRK